jgi:3-hydroxypropanoate dehydrogenase
VSNFLGQSSLDQLFYQGRTFSAWKDCSVEKQLLERLVHLTLLGPTSLNSLPLRIIFVHSQQQKKELLSCLLPGNVEKTKQAPVTAILCYDIEFYNYLPRLYPFIDARPWFLDQPDLCLETALRNSSLQIGYFIMAARSLGLDCGPMSGFDGDKIQTQFLASHPTYRVNCLCNIGYGVRDSLPPRAPRFDESEVSTFI